MNRFHHQSWFKISTIVARGVALIAAVLTVPSPVCGKASTFDRNNVACEYAFDGQATTLLRYYVHGATYVDERAMVHEVATGREYGYALNDMYSVIGIVDDLGNLLEAYHYDVFGTRYADTVSAFEDLYVAIRNRLGQSAAGQTQYDLNGDLTIDLLDLLLLRGEATVAPIPTIQPYAFQGRRRNVYTPTVGATLVLYDYRARTYDPILGRFHQRDPAEYADTYNLYLAMGGNSLRWMDPSGKSLIDLLGAAGTSAQLRMASAMAAGGAMAYFRTIANAIAFRTRFLNAILNTAMTRGADYLIRANEIMVGVNQAVFTASNYREAYIKLIYGPGAKLASNIQVHHVFPKIQKFVEFFESRGINVHNPLFLTEVGARQHAGFSHHYNEAWRMFMARNPNATVDLVFRHAKDLAQQFGFTTQF